MVADKTHQDDESSDNRTSVNYRPVGAVECTECGESKQSGGRLRIRDAGAVEPHYDGLVCETCKRRLTDDD